MVNELFATFFQTPRFSYKIYIKDIIREKGLWHSFLFSSNELTNLLPDITYNSVRTCLSYGKRLNKVRTIMEVVKSSFFRSRGMYLGSQTSYWLKSWSENVSVNVLDIFDNIVRFTKYGNLHLFLYLKNGTC